MLCENKLERLQRPNILNFRNIKVSSLHDS